MISCLLQLVDKGSELVDEGIVAELADPITPPTQCSVIDDGTGMYRACTDISDIGEWCAIGQDDFDGVAPIDGGAITELPPVVEPPTPGGATNQGTTTVVADRDCGHTGEWRAGTSQYLDRP